MDEFARALQFASKNMLAATQGTSLAGKAFQDMGIHLTDSSGKMRSVEAIMLDVADRFSKMEDGAKKTGYAMEIFGRGGARMIPMLNQGRAALEGQRKEAELLGATFTTQGAKAAEEFNENLKRLEAGFTGLRNTVTQALLPFFNEIVGGIIGKMKEWAASGDLRKWAKETSDFIIDAFVAVAHFLDENLVSAVEMATRGFLVMKLAVEGLANGVLVLTNGILGLVWVINEGGLGIRKLLGIQESLGVTTEQVERRVDRVTGMIAENSARIADFSKDINEALSTLWSGEGAGMSDAMKARITGVAETISSAALKIKSWGETAKQAGAEAAKGIAETQKTAMEGPTAQDLLKQTEAFLKAARTRGEATYQMESDYLQKRVAAAAEGSAERAQAEADAFKMAQEISDRIFAHEQTLGVRSLQDAIDREKEKANAAVAGSEARMKAEENVYQKEEELRNKRRTAALGILGEVSERLKAKGVTSATAEDVQREMLDIQKERGEKVRATQEWAGGRGRKSLEEIKAGYEAGGKIEEWNKTLAAQGGYGTILGAGARVGAGQAAGEAGFGYPGNFDETIRNLFKAGRGDLVDALVMKFGAPGPGGEAPGQEGGGAAANITEGLKKGFADAETVVDGSLGRIMSRITRFGDQVRDHIENRVNRALERNLPRIINDQTIRDSGSTP
jgi:hypothetical protein